MTIRKFYKIFAIAIAISLLVSFPIYYFFLSQNSNSNVYHVQGILSVYKNGRLVHQGPDLLTQWFYQYLPYLLGNVCITTNAGSCTGWASNVFTFQPVGIGCPSSNPIPGVGVYSPGVQIGFGHGSLVSTTDCVISTIDANMPAGIYVYSPFTNNPNNAPTPCPRPTAGCIQINATYTATSAITLSEAVLWAAIIPTIYTPIAHDTFSSVTLNQGDTLTITYTFIFPPIPTNVGAFNENQGAIAAMFAQCLGRTYFGVGPTGYRICLDSVLLQPATGIYVYQPSSPCNDMIKPPNSNIVNRSATISILTSSAGKYVKIMAPMFKSGSGTQIVFYNISITTSNYNYTILKASQVCSVAQMNNFTRGQSVGIQLNFP